MIKKYTASKVFFGIDGDGDGYGDTKLAPCVNIDQLIDVVCNAVLLNLQEVPVDPVGDAVVGSHTHEFGGTAKLVHTTVDGVGVATGTI